MEIYVLTVEDTMDDNIVKAFYNLNDASNTLKSLIADFKNKYTDWNDDENYYEETPNTFVWYPYGYYNANHYMINITRTEIV